MNTIHNPKTTDLLKKQYRWMRGGWPLAAANIGLFVTLFLLWRANPSLARVREWGRIPLWWMGGVAFSLAIALVFLVLRRRSIVHGARRLDARLEARNRLETAVLLNTSTDPIARAQRDETAEFLRNAPAKPRHWLLPVLGIAFAFAVLAHFFTLAAWTRPWQAAEQPAAKPTPPANVPKAFIVWKSPAAESSAAPIEEVPLTAEADSTSGLEDMTLEISVNGEHRLSTKVPVDALGKAGKHPIAASMYFDQLNVEPFDMVSYYLHSQRVSQAKLPPTASPMQFVEVKPFREDITRMPGGGGAAGQKAYMSVLALKLAQLRLVKENFLLAHAEIDHADAAWVKENQRVGGEQGVLETKTGEVAQLLTEAGIGANFIDLLNQARPLMTDASGKISAKNNDAALPVQGKSLALITETEKYLRKVLATPGMSAAQSQPKPRDPFEKRKDLDLKQRSATPAGELEKLAKDQEQLAQDTAKSAQQDQQNSNAPPNNQGPSQAQGTPAERQAQLNQRMDALMNNQAFAPAVADHLQNGRKEADETLKQLNAGDPKQAQEPAAAAARELKLAAAEMNKAGEQKAMDQIAEAVRTLDEAASQAQGAPQQNSDADARAAAQKTQDNVTQAKADLAAAAQNQQETGSEKAAARLADFAKMLNDDKLRGEMQQLRDQPRDTAKAAAVAGTLNQIADQLAAEPDSVPKTPDQIAQLIDRMNRSKANLERLAAMEAAANGGKGNQNPGQEPGPQPGASPAAGGRNAEQQRQAFANQVLDDVRQEVADAQAILPAQSTNDFRNALPRGSGGRGGNVIAYFGKIAGPLSSVISLLRAEMLNSKREHDLADQSESAAPAAYRDAVADYFEQLSRDYEKSSPPADHPTQ